MTRRATALLAALVLLASSLVVVVPSISAEPIGDPAFQRVWERTDRAVAEGVVARSWLWGQEAFTGVLEESYTEAPNGMRRVQYFDKSRMEITDPDADPNAEWYVSNGLLAKELITGQQQVGHNDFEDRKPAEVGVAGDPDDEFGPLYSTFGMIQQHTERVTGEHIVDSLYRDGSVTVDEVLSAYDVRVGPTEPLTGYSTADVFQAFIDAQGPIWEDGAYTTGTVAGVFAVGLPITEAYWAIAKVAGSYQDVLVQCFERRCLTYTPANPPEWRVEHGNIGQHYVRWLEDTAPEPAAPLSVHYIDVGQGDATLIQSPDATILIDAGRLDGDEVVPYLQAVGVTEIDLLIGTHPHDDHIGQFAQVLEAFPVSEVWMTGETGDGQFNATAFDDVMNAIANSGADYHEPRAGEAVDFGPVTLEVLHPSELDDYMHYNTMVLRLVYGEQAFLFMSDLESSFGSGEVKGEDAMIERGHDISAQYVRLANHGANTSAGDAFITGTGMEVAIYSAGADNPYGYPHDDLLGRLEAWGVTTVYGTDVHGTIVITVDGQGWEDIDTEK